MKSILGIGNALTDLLAVFPDDTLLREYHLPPGSMQHVDLETGDEIWSKLKEYGVNRVSSPTEEDTGRPSDCSLVEDSLNMVSLVLN